MPRTRAQRRATQGPLGGLNDDALRRVLTFLSVADSRRGASGASKALRGVATSNELARLRGSDSYLLRRSENGSYAFLMTHKQDLYKNTEPEEEPIDPLVHAQLGPGVVCGDRFGRQVLSLS